MARSDIRFWFRGRIQSVDDCPPQLTVLRWLREFAKSLGTKEGCAEGDCGACTVTIGTLDPSAPHGLRLMAVNSCIQFLPTLDGKALFTVEDLQTIAGYSVPATNIASDDTRTHSEMPSETFAGRHASNLSDAASQIGRMPSERYAILHPVQQAMVECHGSQCGFCTPGFVMSLWTDYENRLASSAGAAVKGVGTAAQARSGPGTDFGNSQAPNRKHVQAVISGNLCRCTGYRPIIDAAIKAWELPRVALDREPVRSALEEIAKLPPLAYEQSKQRFWAPKTVDELAAIYGQNPNARIVAGSTDAGLWVSKQLKNLGDIIYVGDVRELKEVTTLSGRAASNINPTVDGNTGGAFSVLSIGASVNLDDAYAELTMADPAWGELGLRFASLPVRNAGTLGGNIANASPIGDSMPPLIALCASVVLQKESAVREMPLEDFYLEYQKTARQSGEFVKAVRLPYYRPAFEPDSKTSAGKKTFSGPYKFFRVWKISKRFDQDISAVCGAFALHWHEGLNSNTGNSNGSNTGTNLTGAVAGVRVAFGGMAAIPKRAVETEKVLAEYFDSTELHRAVSSASKADALFAKTDTAIEKDFKPLTDMRATDTYRLKVAQNLVRRFVLEFVRALNGKAGGTVPVGGFKSAMEVYSEVLSLAELNQ